MIVTLYVNWNDGTILNEKQAEEIAKKYCADATESIENFNEWLYENYSHAELFDADENEKKAIYAEFMQAMVETAWNDFLADGYEEVFVKIF